MTGECNVGLMLMNAEIDNVGQRIFLGIDLVGLDRRNKVTHINGRWDKPKRAKNLLVKVIVQSAQTQAATIVSAQDRPFAVAEMAKAIVPIAQDLVIR